MANQAIVHLVPDPETATAQFVVADPATKKCALIDSVLDIDGCTGKTSTASADKLVQVVNDNQYEVEWILDTHVHADHITGMAYLKTKFPGAKRAIGKEVVTVQHTFQKVYNLPEESIQGQFWDVLFEDNQEFSIGNLKVTCLHTPGHTPADLSYYIENDAVFTGDSIFMPDMGTARCDFPGGSADTLWDSVQRIMQLHPDVRVFVGHDYKPGGREYQAETTVQQQKSLNKHVADGTEPHVFKEMRTTRDAQLGPPKLLHPAIQWNIRGGERPLPEADGKSYVKVPIS